MPDDPELLKGQEAGLAGLIALYSALRDEVNTQRSLLFSNLAVAFTIPLGALAVQETGVFNLPHFWCFPQPARWIFGSWCFGVSIMAVGAILLLRETFQWTKMEDISTLLRDGRIHPALERLAQVVDQQYHQLSRVLTSRVFFYIAILFFSFSVILEFGIILFHTQHVPHTIPIPIPKPSA